MRKYRENWNCEKYEMGKYWTNWKCGKCEKYEFRSYPGNLENRK